MIDLKEGNVNVTDKLSSSANDQFQTLVVRLKYDRWNVVVLLFRV